MSLKQRLNNLIQNRYPECVSLEEIEQLCNLDHYKLSNAERRLRQSDSPNVRPVWNDKHTAIIGYVWNEERKASLKQFRVKSQSELDKEYMVTDLGSFAACTCPAYKFNHTCKHSQTVWNRLTQTA